MRQLPKPPIQRLIMQIWDEMTMEDIQAWIEEMPQRCEDLVNNRYQVEIVKLRELPIIVPEGSLGKSIFDF